MHSLSPVFLSLSLGGFVGASPLVGLFGRDIKEEPISIIGIGAPFECFDLRNPSDECRTKLAEEIGDKRPSFIFERNCNASQQAQVLRSGTDAITLADQTSMDTGPEKAIFERAIWELYMGMELDRNALNEDHPSEEKITHRQRVEQNLARAAAFRGGSNGLKIIISCDTNHEVCFKYRNVTTDDGKQETRKLPVTAAGHAVTFTDEHDGEEKSWINLCEIFFKAETLQTRYDQVKKAVEGGDLSMAEQASWQHNAGEALLHEIMHLYAVSGVQPHIVDVPFPPGQRTDTSKKDDRPKAYGPWRVYELANRKRGTKWATQNADSYAWLANSLWFYRNLDKIPRPISPTGESPYGIEARTELVFLHLGDFDQSAASDEVEIMKRAEEEWESVTEDLPDLPDEWPDDGGDTGGDDHGNDDLQCHGVQTNTFLGRDDLNGKISQFCADAAAQKVQDQDSGGTMRKYNEGSRYDVELRMDWPSGQDISEGMEEKCKQKMTLIMDSCDGNDPGNPLNWKHGGTLKIGDITYGIHPKVDQSYRPGSCSFHLRERHSFFGIDGPGTRRNHWFHVEKLMMFDNDKKEIGRAGYKKDSGDGEWVECGHDSPFTWEDIRLPDTLRLTAEAQGGNYIQFNIGDRSWKSLDSEGDKRCEVGGWDGDYSPVYRQMDCFFPC